MNARLNVEHKGKPKMVGKLFEHGGRHFFLHKVNVDSQEHRNLVSPGGIDRAVLHKLQFLQPVIGDVVIVHRTPKGSWTATRELVSQGNRVQQDGRDRYFLPWPMWTPMPVRLDYDPFCPEQILCEAPPVDWVPLAVPQAPQAPVATPKGALPGQGGLGLQLPTRWIVFYSLDGRMHATRHQEGCGVLARARLNDKSDDRYDKLGQHGIMEEDRYAARAPAAYPVPRDHSCIGAGDGR